MFEQHSAKQRFSPPPPSSKRRFVAGIFRRKEANSFKQKFGPWEMDVLTITMDKHDCQMELTELTELTELNELTELTELNELTELTVLTELNELSVSTVQTLETVKTVQTEDLKEYDLLTAARYAGASKQAPKAGGCAS